MPRPLRLSSFCFCLSSSCYIHFCCRLLIKDTQKKSHLAVFSSQLSFLWMEKRNVWISRLTRRDEADIADLQPQTNVEAAAREQKKTWQRMWSYRFLFIVLTTSGICTRTNETATRLVGREMMKRTRGPSLFYLLMAESAAGTETMASPAARRGNTLHNKRLCCI